MIRRPPRPTRTDTLVPSTPLCRSTWETGMKRIWIGVVTGITAELAALLPAAARTFMAGTPLSIERIAHSPFTLFLACDGIGKVAAATAAATLVTTARQMRRL